MPLFLSDVSVVSLIIAIASIGASIGGAIYSYQKNKKNRGISAAEDFGLSNIASQGAFVPLLIGRRRIGAVIAWVGDPWAKPPRRSKGQGWLYEQKAWHLLCVGPAYKLHKIWSNGEVIFPDPNYTLVGPGTTVIDSVTVPSGTLVQTYAGDFRIYWGEPDQPVNTFLAASSRVGIASRWPHCCYVVWERFGLQLVPQWPQLEYEVETVPYITAIEDAKAFVEPVFVNGAPEDDDYYYGPNGGYALAQILLESYPHGAGLGGQLARFDYTAGASGGDEVLSRIHTTPCFDNSNGSKSLTGEAAGDPSAIDAGLYDLTYAPPYYSGGGMEEEANWVGIYLYGETGNFTRIHVYLQGPSGQKITLYDQAPGDFYDGSDIFSWTPPTGWGVDTDLQLAFTQFDVDEVTLDEDGIWDLHVDYDVTFDNSPNEQAEVQAQVTLVTGTQAPTGSFYDFLETMDTEGLAVSVSAENGEEAGAVVSQLMTELGVTLPINCDGNMALTPIRQVADADVIQLDQDQVLPPAAQIDVVHADRPLDRVIYSYPDVARNYRESTVQIDEDGQASEANNVKGTVIQLRSVVDFEVASKVGERRSQEELAQASRFRINLARGAHRLKPGVVINVPDVADYLRVSEVLLSDTSDKAEVTCVTDFYGAAPQTYQHTFYPAPEGFNYYAAPNLQEDFFELPEHLGVRGQVLIVPLHIRDGLQIVANILNFSEDGTDYYQVDDSSRVHSGGTIKAGSSIAVDDPWLIEIGPEFTLVGEVEDLTEYFEDLTGSEALWRQGKQMALINNEIFFVRKVTFVSGTTYRLDGLIRARFDTARGAHAEDDEVFLFTLDNLEAFAGTEVYPGSDFYLKQQPFASGSPVNLADVTATNKTLYGKGVTPMPPGCLRVTAPRKGVAAYYTGEDVTFEWSWRSTTYPGTGAGLQPAGNAIGVSPINGTFEAEVYNTSDTKVATYALGAVATWTYDNADIQADLGGEVDFYVKIRNVNGGWKSSPVQLSVEAL